MAQPRVVIPGQEDEAVTFKTCNTIRGGCQSTWRYILGGIIAVTLITAGTLYAMQSSTADTLADTREKVSAQDAKLTAIDQRTQEMSRDIKDLLRRR